MRLISSYTEKGLGLSDLMHTLAKADGMGVKVGVLGSAGTTENGTSIVDIALIHELGAPKAGIPERSFLRSTFEAKSRQLSKLAEQMARKAMEGQGVELSLNLIGTYLAAEIKKTIADRRTAGPERQANADSTIARKGSDLPLVDTGQLLNSITYTVAHSGGE